MNKKYENGQNSSVSEIDKRVDFLQDMTQRLLRKSSRWYRTDHDHIQNIGNATILPDGTLYHLLLGDIVKMLTSIKDENIDKEMIYKLALNVDKPIVVSVDVKTDRGSIVPAVVDISEHHVRYLRKFFIELIYNGVEIMPENIIKVLADQLLKVISLIDSDKCIIFTDNLDQLNQVIMETIDTCKRYVYVEEACILREFDYFKKVNDICLQVLPNKK